MIVEAELILRHNWSDVAIHDRNKLADVPVGHYCAWIVGEFGSYLSPLYCSIDDKKRWEKDAFAPIQILFMRWLNKENPLFESSDYLFRIGPHTQNCYIIVKTDSDWGGTITPVDYLDFVDLCFCGRLKLEDWSDEDS